MTAHPLRAGNGGGHDTYFDNGDFGNTTLSSNPAITLSLDTSALGSPTGFTLTSITTLNGWQNYDDSFSNQAYSVYFSTVSAPATFNLLATVNYHPFTHNSPNAGGGGGATSSLVVLTLGPTEAVGVSSLRFVLTPSTIAGLDAQGGYVIREFQATGIATAVPEPSTYALMIAGAAGLLFLARRQRVRI